MFLRNGRIYNNACQASMLIGQAFWFRHPHFQWSQMKGPKSPILVDRGDNQNQESLHIFQLLGRLFKTFTLHKPREIREREISPSSFQPKNIKEK